MSSEGDVRNEARFKVEIVADAAVEQVAEATSLLYCDFEPREKDEKVCAHCGQGAAELIHDKVFGAAVARIAAQAEEIAALKSDLDATERHLRRTVFSLRALGRAAGFMADWAPAGNEAGLVAGEVQRVALEGLEGLDNFEADTPEK